jgi:hypothetical protein
VELKQSTVDRWRYMAVLEVSSVYIVNLSKSACSISQNTPVFSHS